MNYRHAFHAGSFTDVIKHIVLARILTYLQEKPAAFRVIDTHADLRRHPRMLDILIAADISSVGILKIVYMVVRSGMRRLTPCETNPPLGNSLGAQ